MMVTDTQLPVRLSKVHLKLDSEGGKWGTFNLRMKIDDPGILQKPLLQGYELMKSDTAFDELTTEQKMDGVQLEFQNGAGAGEKTIFEPKELFGFTFNRESSTQAGTLKKDRGAVELEFRFTVGLAVAGVWALQNFGNDILVTIFKTQAELDLGDPTNPDSQAARNARIVEGEAQDGADETGAEDPPPENAPASGESATKPKRKKKSKKTK